MAVCFKQKRMRLSGTTIGFLAENPLEDKRAFSGTMYSMVKALESTGARVVRIPVDSSSSLRKLYMRAVKYIGKLFPPLKGRFGKLLVWKSRIVARKLDLNLIDNCDVIFAPIQSGALFFLRTNKPIVYLSDATFHAMIDYYWFDYPKRDIEELEMIQKTALDKAAALIYPCRWAADSAVSDYGQPREKITLAYFGPNLDVKKISSHVFSFDGHLDLLFVGVDWKRKGGDIAVGACKWLNENGIDATLHVVGIKSLDPSISSLPYVANHGFLNKNNPEEYSKIMSLYNQADCFLLPTLAECTGISFCEASAYGLPCFTHDTGGVSDYVIEGQSGRLLPLGSTGEDFGRVIKNSIESGEMELFSKGARQVVDERLSWELWAETVAGVIEKLV